MSIARKKSTPLPTKKTPTNISATLSPSPLSVKQNVLLLPVPALLEERKEADALVKQLIDTLPTRLDTEAQMGQASEHLVISRKLRKAFEEKVRELKKPFDEAVENIKNDYNPYVVRLKGVEDKLNLLISAYRTEATRKQQVEEQRLREQHQKTMDQARAQGVNPLSIPAPLPAAAPPTGFQTTHGKTQTMRVPRWKCVDPAQVPYEHAGVKLWLLNEAGIGTLRRGAGIEAVSPIAGIEYYYDETTVVK